MNRAARYTAWTAGVLVGAGTLVAGPAQAVVGDAAGGGQRAYTAKIEVGDTERACSGALVEARWVVTAASCFAEDPTQPVPAGPPSRPTRVTVGRTDLTTTSGQVRTVVELVPRTDRDLVLARLSAPVTGITPVALGTGAPVAGEQLTAAGYGRTGDQWVPDRLHTGAFTVTGVRALELDIDGQDGAAVCQGDAGGPVVRAGAGGDQLVAVNSRSWQGGCLGTEETRTGAIASRADDLAAWVDAAVAAPHPLKNQSTARCLAVPQASTDNGTKLIQWTCTGNSEQQWRLDKVAGGNGDRYLVRNLNSNRCLAIPQASSDNGIQAIQWTCTGNSEQIWIRDSVGRLRNLNSDKCLAVPGSDPTNGTKVVQWTCSTNTDQRWIW
ncbi:RICIN domain-containing protein [Streptomyces sp. NPDC018693]|uniref:RICIN domain-containing protein n=1 Tax=unclassified Streptomyces TaxID=2593676 RepID=UPI00378A0D02